VVVRDFDVVGITSLPAETDSILLIDADAVLSLSISHETLQPIARWDRELPQVADPVKLSQFPANHCPKRRRTRGTSSPAVQAIEEIFGG